MMKNKIVIVILSVILALAVIISVCSLFVFAGSEKISAYFSVFSFSDEFRNEYPFSRYNYELLNETEKKAYICIFENIGKHPEYIKIPKLTKEEFNNVYFAVKNDNPHMLCFSDSCNMVTFWSAAFVELHYNSSAEECNRMQDVMFTQIRNIIEQMPDYPDDFSKELYIHDYIVNSCIYQETGNASSAYGCIVENKAICSGYSRAAMLLLDCVGIKSVLLGGTGISPTKGRISHMWNVVWVDGEPYHLDVTWDDPGLDENVSHLYFNLTDNEISSDHSDYNFAYLCDFDRYNYFKHNGLFFSEYGKSQLDIIQNKLYENIEMGANYLEITFDSEDAFRKAEKAIINGASTYSDMYKIISFISSRAGDKVDVSHVNFTSDENKKYIRLMFDWN